MLLKNSGGTSTRACCARRGKQGCVAVNVFKVLVRIVQPPHPHPPAPHSAAHSVQCARDIHAAHAARTCARGV